MRYVPLLAAGVVVFLGIVFLGAPTGLLWHIRTFDWWVKLSPSVLEPAADWVVWAVCFLLTLSPAIIALLRRRVPLEPLVALTSLIFPTLSLIAVAFSYWIGIPLLISSGFLAGYALVSRSSSLISVERGLALRVVLAEVFGLLSVAAAGSVVSILIWQQDFFLALVSGSSLVPMDSWLNMLAIDLETFYLARPVLTVLFFILAAAAVIALLRQPLRRIVRSLSRMSADGLGSTPNPDHAPGHPGEVAPRRWFPYLVLVGSLALGIAIGLYPYMMADVDGVLGVDSRYYIENLRSMNSINDVVPFLHSLEQGRAVFFLVLFAVKSLTGLSADWVVRLMPALLSSLLSLSTFLLAREGTGRSSVAALAALLSVVSAQTALGMSAGIINNWFALSIANFVFALIVRSVTSRSRLVAVGAAMSSVILLASYAFLWVAFIAEVVLVLFASIGILSGADRHERKREVGILAATLSGSILFPASLLIVTAPLLGYNVQGIDPTVWFTQAWSYLAQVQPQLIGSVPGVFEEAFDFAGNRIDLPFMTLLSVVGLLDCRFQRPSFNRIMAAMVLVPFLMTVVISVSSASSYTPMWLTWRGLYIIPLYLTGALGIESIIRRVNGSTSPWSRSCLAFAGTFAAYIFLSHLSYSLRALELLIIVSQFS
jgi:hypothetical protein